MPRSRQLNFYLSAVDQKVVEIALTSCCEVLIFDARSLTPSPQKRPTMRVEKFGEEPLRIVVAPAMYADDIVYRPINGRRDYSSNVLKMPIIEFDRCYVGDGYIRRGRIYAAVEYYDDEGELIQKPKAFVDWVNCVFERTTKSLAMANDGCLIGEDALLLQEKGWLMKSL